MSGSVTSQVRFRVKGTKQWSAYGHPTTALTETLQGLQPNTTYEIEVLATNSVGGVASNIITVSTSGRLPSAPDAPAPGLITASTIVLNWNPSATGTPPINYQPMYRTHNVGGYQAVGTPIAGTSVVVTGLSPQTSYDFEVVAMNGAGSATSAPMTVATLPLGSAPSAPTGLALSGITSTQVNLSWTASASGTQPITYQPQYRRNGLTTWTPFGAALNGTSVTITGLTAATSYDFSVVATNTFGSTTSAVTTNSTLSGVVAPGTPGTPTASAITSAGLTVNWTAPGTGTAPFSYQLQQSPSVSPPAWQNVNGQVSGLSEAVASLQASTTYLFQVIASNSAGSATSATLTVTTAAANIAPSAPTGLATSSITSTSIGFSWSPSTGTAPINYQPQYRVTGNATWLNGTLTSTPSATITALTAGTNYQLQVVATNTAGSATSSIITATTSAAAVAPSAPGSLASSVIGASGLTLSWTASTGTAPIAYQIQYQLSGGSTWTNGPSVNATSAAVTGLLPTTAYVFRVVASNSAGTATSATLSATTLPGDSSGTTASRIADMLEMFGVNCFPNGQDGAGAGYNNANDTVAAYLTGLSYLTASTGMGLTCRIYNDTANAATQASFCTGISGSIPVKWSVCYAVGSTQAGFNASADALLTANCLAFVEGPNEPNSATGFGTNLNNSAALAIQQSIYNRYHPQGVLVAAPALADLTSSNTYITDYWASNLSAVIAACDLFNGHDYPAGGAPSTDMWRRTALYSNAGFPARGIISEFNAILSNNTTDDATVATYTAWALLVAYKFFNANALIFFDMYDYTGMAHPAGLFTGFSSSTPHSAAKVIHNYFALCTDAGAARRAFGPGKLNVTVSGLPAIWSGQGSIGSGGGQWHLFQGSNGKYYMVLQNEQSTLNTSATTPVTVTFNGAVMSSVVDYSITNPITDTPSAIQTLANVRSIVLNMVTETRILQITYSGPVTESGNGATITAPGSTLVDHSLNQWRLTGTGPYTVEENPASGSGWAAAGTGGAIATLLLYYSQRIYRQSASGWTYWSGTAWTAAPGDPRVPESANGTTLTNSTGSIVDSRNVTWTLVGSSLQYITPGNGSITDIHGQVWTISSANDVYINGSLAPNGGGTAQLAYNSATDAMYAQDLGTGNWFQWDGVSNWNPVSAPVGSQQIHHGSLTDGSNVVLLLYWNHLVYQENSTGGWWYWNDGTAAYVASSDPRVAGESPNNTTVTDTTGSIVDSGGVVWKLVTSAANGLQINHAGTTDGANVILLLYWNHVVYQENSALGWWYWNNATSAYVGTTDPRTTSGGANLTFSDHFDGATIDWTKWNACFNYATSGNAYDGSTTSFAVNPNYSGTSDPSLNPLSIGNSILTMSIKPIPSQFQGSLTGNKQYICGVLVTQDKFSQQYGYFEARMRMHTLTGLLSAFWLLPADGSWPPEIDITEIHADIPGTNITTVHSNNSGNTANPPYQSISDSSVNWHTYGVEWTATTLTWYVDRVAVASGANPSDCTKPFYILLTDYAGSANTWYPAPPPSSGPWPNSMLIDYVMVWDAKPFGTGTVSDITLSNSTIAPGAPSGTMVGHANVVMSDGSSFVGSLSLSGANASSFTLSGDTLATATVLVAGNYSITITATPNSGAALSRNFNVSAVASGGVGPAATSNFVTADFTNLTPPGALLSTDRATVYPELFGVATGGIVNNNWALAKNATWRSLVRALNLPLIRLNSAYWDATNPANIQPFSSNVANFLPSTCRIIVGAWLSNQAQYKAVADYWTANATLPCSYWEIGNETGQSETDYQNSFAPGSAGFRQSNASFKVGGPAYAGSLDYNWIRSFVNANNATTLGFFSYHQYLYCYGQEATPTDADTCLAIHRVGSPNNYYTNQMHGYEAAIAGTWAQGRLPCIIDEYNIECSASWNDMRAQSSVGAAFLASSLLGFAAGAYTVPAWGGIWDITDDGGAGYNLIDYNLNLSPQYYTLQQLIAKMPGTMVNTSSGSTGSGVQGWATKSGTKIGVTIINSNGSNVSGPVALSHWPVNTTGSSNATLWTYPTTSSLNVPGTTSTITVTNGVTQSITVPAHSLVMISVP